MPDKWNILIAQSNVKMITRFQKIFKDNPLRYEDKDVVLHCATTSVEARKILLDKDIHLSLISVSLEQVDSGLGVISFIRTQLHNSETRVVMLVDYADAYSTTWASETYKINGINSTDRLLQDNVVKTELTMQLHEYAHTKKLKRRLVASVNNVEAMMNQAKQVKSAKNFLSTILTEFTPLPMILTDDDGIVVRFNKAAEAFYSVPASAALGFKFSKVSQDIGIGDDYREIVKTLVVDDIYRKKYTRYVRGETITMTFTFQPVYKTASTSNREGYAIIGDTAILSSEITSTGVEEDLSLDLLLPEIFTVEQNMLRVSEQIKVLSKSLSTVVLLGKSGVGKEFFARLIHKYSPRKARSFVAVNCAVLQEHFEEELFGSESGHKSVLERCDGGTLYLGNVHRINQKAQGRLLGFLLQGGFYHSVTGEFVTSDVRLVVSMNQQSAHSDGLTRFNEDLYYRLTTTSLYLPSMSERKADVPFLIKGCLKLNKCVNFELTDRCMQACIAYDWPGNIREINNTAQYIALAKITNRPVDLEDLPAAVRWQSTKGIVADIVFDHKSDIPKVDLETALRQFDGNISRAADFFGMSRTAFYKGLVTD